MFPEQEDDFRDEIWRRVRRQASGGSPWPMFTAGNASPCGSDSISFGSSGVQGYDQDEEEGSSIPTDVRTRYRVGEVKRVDTLPVPTVITIGFFD